MDSNFDIVPTLRMFDGVMMGKAADEIEALRKEVAALRNSDAPASHDAIVPPPNDLQCSFEDAPATAAHAGAITLQQIKELETAVCNGATGIALRLLNNMRNALAAPTAAVDDGMHKALMTWQGPDTSERDRWAFQQGFKARESAASPTSDSAGAANG